MNDEVQISEQRLRSVIGRLFALKLRNDEFRDIFTESSGWTAGSPVIPCHGGTLFGEVHAIAMPAIRDTGARTVAIPVLQGIEGGSDSVSISMSILTMGVREGEPYSERAIDINSISHNVTMAQVVETLAPNKKWEISDLDKDYTDLTCEN